MSFIESIKERARQDVKRIVMPETNDRRTLMAAAEETGFLASFVEAHGCGGGDKRKDRRYSFYRG